MDELHSNITLKKSSAIKSYKKTYREEGLALAGTRQGMPVSHRHGGGFEGGKRWRIREGEREPSPPPWSSVLCSGKRVRARVGDSRDAADTYQKGSA